MALNDIVSLNISKIITFPWPTDSPTKFLIFQKWHHKCIFLLFYRHPGLYMYQNSLLRCLQGKRQKTCLHFTNSWKSFMNGKVQNGTTSKEANFLLHYQLWCHFLVFLNWLLIWPDFETISSQHRQTIAAMNLGSSNW